MMTAAPAIAMAPGISANSKTPMLSPLAGAGSGRAMTARGVTDRENAAV
jgi:hypothetical protein